MPTDQPKEEKPVEEPAGSGIKKVEIEGFKFEVDVDLLDDVEAFEYIDKIENKGQAAAIVPLLTFLIDSETYRNMKAHFTQQDAEEHKDQPGYKARFRMEKLAEVYKAILEQFDPKG